MQSRAIAILRGTVDPIRRARERSTMRSTRCYRTARTSRLDCVCLRILRARRRRRTRASVSCENSENPMRSNMNPTKSPHSRASEVWARLVGLFGGETVARKFGDEPPAEWVGVISQLTGYQLERGMKRLLASGKASIPSLPEFRRMCVEVSNDDLDPPRSVGLIAEPAYPGDAWDMAANRHLLAHILRSGQKRHYYNAEQ